VHGNPVACSATHPRLHLPLEFGQELLVFFR
jgi:hypothetical protein